MPAAPRASQKATKIAYAILGRPVFEQKKRSKKQAIIDKKLEEENTSLFR